MLVTVVFTIVGLPAVTELTVAAVAGVVVIVLVVGADGYYVYITLVLNSHHFHH